MTSHDMPVEEILKLLEADKKAAKGEAHQHVYDHTYYMLGNYCICGAWEGVGD